MSGRALALQLCCWARWQCRRTPRISTSTRSPNGSGDLPNVLFILDSSANWSSSIPAADCFYKDGGVTTTAGPKGSNPGKEQGKKVAIEKCALYNLLDALPVSDQPAAPTTTPCSTSASCC